MKFQVLQSVAIQQVALATPLIPETRYGDNHHPIQLIQHYPRHRPQSRYCNFKSRLPKFTIKLHQSEIRLVLQQIPICNTIRRTGGLSMSWSSIVSARLECQGTYQPPSYVCCRQATDPCRFPLFIKSKRSLRLSCWHCMCMYTL